jgi:aspartyl-tRNA(Asn)/glutamyl-tRNA(Gln) amidotransferase subunit B
LEYEPVIGLEVHVELKTATKLFCGCSTTFGSDANTQVCPVCLGLPGVLPVMNEKAVEYAAKVGLALNCTVAPFSKMDRKNYYYPDLSKAYQISQYDKPINIGWASGDHTKESGTKRIGITRAHLEEDAGKLVHQGGKAGRLDASDYSLADYNRGGIPLVEIVSEPDLRSAEEAHAYLTELKNILLYSGVSDCNMEEGSLRCDANVSVRPKGQVGVRDPGRDQEHELVPFRQASHRVRDQTPDRALREGRTRGAGIASVGHPREQDASHAV